MKRHPLTRLVKSFRKGILNGKDSTLMCFAVCAPLQGYLSMLGVKTQLVEGNIDGFEHFWLELSDGTIIDPTADQFEHVTHTAVYVGPRPACYEVERVGV